MRVLAIDPGVQSGAWAFIDGNSKQIHNWALGDFPMIGKKLDVPSLYRAIGEMVDIDACIMEQQWPRPGLGLKSVFSMGHAFGLVEGILLSLKCPLYIVSPQKWKAAMMVTKDKDYSIERAKMIHPLVGASLSRKKDHNRAEAFLIGVYLLRHAPTSP